MPQDTPTSPALSSGSQNDEQSLEDILSLLREQQKRATQSRRKKQQAILDEGKELAKQYDASVRAVLEEGRGTREKRVQQFKDEEKRLKSEIEATEKELLGLLQVEAVRPQEAKGIDAAVAGLWQPVEQHNADEDGAAAEAVAAQA
ncbi:hypothetical protein JCM6882_009396 [Rhodosporidiobolus microsporus]